MSRLDKHSTTGDPNWEKKDIKRKTKDLLDVIAEYTKRLHAEGKRSILLVLQGMDASGKDGITRTIFSRTSPTWLNVHSFKKPTDEEFAHDFLWRIHQRVPKAGSITVFNRSHYEDILVPSVYGYIDEATIEKRYEQINNFEKHLEENGTTIIKCYLNLSYEQQYENLNDRLETPEKYWKFAKKDWETRKHWPEFMAVYEQIFEKCNDVPWNIIPCDKNWVKRYAVAKLLADKMIEMDPQYPLPPISVDENLTV